MISQSRWCFMIIFSCIVISLDFLSAYVFGTMIREVKLSFQILEIPLIQTEPLKSFQFRTWNSASGKKTIPNSVLLAMNSWASVFRILNFSGFRFWAINVNQMARLNWLFNSQPWRRGFWCMYHDIVVCVVCCTITSVIYRVESVKCFNKTVFIMQWLLD